MLMQPTQCLYQMRGFDDNLLRSIYEIPNGVGLEIMGVGLKKFYRSLFCLLFVS